MDILRLSLLSDYRARLVAVFPRVTAAQLLRLDDRARADRLVGDDGHPTKALEEWVQAVIGDEPPEAVLAALPPAPEPVPGGSEIEVRQ